MRRLAPRFAAAATAMIACPLVAASLGDESLTSEDGPLEMSSALVFLLAAIGGAARLTVSGLTTRRAGGLVLAALTALSGLAAMDELSFGARYFDWEPYVVAGTPIDGAHDLLAVAWRLLQWSPFWFKLAALMAATAGALAVLALAWRLRGPIAAAWRVADQPMIAAAALAALACVVAQLLDAAAPASSAAGAVEEALELSAALLALSAATGVTRVMGVGPGAFAR